MEKLVTRNAPLLVDVGERLLLCLLIAPWLVAFAGALPQNPGLITSVASELLVVVFILIRRPGRIALTPYAFAVGFLGTALPLCVRPIPGAHVIPASQALMLCGLALSISSKLALNRRFGIVAANRGVQTRGPYALVRHPMYAGYVITQVGFLISNPTFWNFSVYGCGFVFQLLRISEEEKLLKQDEAYMAFAERVRYRLVPGLF
jgi:protein-S-isoprenylcysteine O-methyltransferase Ste14